MTRTLTQKQKHDPHLAKPIREYAKKLDHYEHIDLDDFLATTATMKATEAERLRLLAIEVEYDVTTPQALRRIYARATACEPANPVLLQSWAIAMSRGDWPENPHVNEKELLNEARFIAEKSLALAPDDAHGHHTLGHVLYEANDPENALRSFERAAS